MSNNNKVIFSLAYAEIWNRIIYYGVQATLVIYLINFLNISESRAYQLYGSYTALTLGFSLLGGILADKVFGYFYTVVLGSFLVMVGNTLLSFENKDAIFFAISCIAVGVGLFKPNNSSLLGDIVNKRVDDKGRIFSIFYLFINVGSLIGPLIYGYFINSNYKYIYFITTFGMFSAVLVLNRFCNSQIRRYGTQFYSRLHIVLIAIFSIFLAVIASNILLRFEKLTDLIVAVFTLINIFFLIRILQNVSHQERIKLKLLVVPMVSSIFYFILLLQIYASILTYINFYVDRNILGWTIPASWFSTLEPLFLIASVPLLGIVWSKLNKRNIIFSESNKIILGLGFASISFLTFAMASATSNHQLNLTLLIIANYILALAELCVIPISISMINTIAPIKYKSTLMAIYYSSLAVSGYLAGLAAKASLVSRVSGPAAYTFSFLLMSLFIFVLFIMMLLVNYRINSN